jgi:hypothetical protein
MGCNAKTWKKTTDYCLKTTIDVGDVASPSLELIPALQPDKRNANPTPGETLALKIGPMAMFKFFA